MFIFSLKLKTKIVFCFSQLALFTSDKYVQFRTIAETAITNDVTLRLLKDIQYLQYSCFHYNSYAYLKRLIYTRHMRLSLSLRDLFEIDLNRRIFFKNG